MIFKWHKNYVLIKYLVEIWKKKSPVWWVLISKNKTMSSLLSRSCRSVLSPAGHRFLRWNIWMSFTKLGPPAGHRRNYMIFQNFVPILLVFLLLLKLFFYTSQLRTMGRMKTFWLLHYLNLFKSFGKRWYPPEPDLAVIPPVGHPNLFS